MDGIAIRRSRAEVLAHGLFIHRQQGAALLKRELAWKGRMVTAGMDKGLKG